MPGWLTDHFLVFDFQALWRSTMQSAWKSKTNKKLSYHRGTARRAVSRLVLCFTRYGN